MSEGLKFALGVPAAFAIGMGAMLGLATDLSLRVMFAIGRWGWVLILLLGED